MEILEKLKKIRGAEAALGITLLSKEICEARLPVGAKLLGYTDSLYFCYVEGYLETVFAVDDISEQEWKSWPIAYDTCEFVKLILSCADAELAARSSFMDESAFRVALNKGNEMTNRKLQNICATLSLEPIEDPYRYTHTIIQLLDCNRVIRK